MKLNKLLLGFFLFFSFLYADAGYYAYNVYPSSSGFIKYEIYNSDGSLYSKKEVSETNKVTLNINKSTNGNLDVNVNVSSGYEMTKPTIILFDSNFNVISYKQFPDNATNLYWSVPEDKIKDGTNNYNFAYAGIYKDKKFIFYFKPIQITKVYVNLEIKQVAAGSTSFPNENKGYVGDQFAFVGITNVKLPDSYGMYIAFMDVDENGKNTGYFGPYYRMVKKDDTTYYYKKTIQKAGNNREFKICIKNNQYQDVDCKTGNYTVLEKPVQITLYNIEKLDETDDYVDFQMKFTLSSKPKNIKLISESNNEYDLLKYDLMAGYMSFKPKFVTSMKYSNDYKDWTVNFRIYKSNEYQYKSFTLQVSNDTGNDSQTLTFGIPKKQNPEEYFTDILNFINKSPVIAKLNLGNSKIRYAPISRAEAALIVYEFLKLKNSNFKLPYDIELYSNPFADLDKNTNYYDAVITLANYKGDDNITVLTKKFGVFNPLDYVTRFQFVKMIIEGLNIPKTNDFSYIKNYSDYKSLGEDAKIYFATAVKNGIIKGDNNKLLPYQDLTIFQALTILDRVKNYSFNVNTNQFDLPDFEDKGGTTLGIIPDYQNYNPDITPIKINGIKHTKDGNCTKLAVDATLDKNATGYYVWSANFGYFKKVDENNKEVIFCPATKKPDVDYQIKVLGNDGYFNFDEYNITLNRNDYIYLQNISDKNASVVKFNLSLSLPNKKMKENGLFVIDKTGSVYKNNLNIGLEKVSVVLSDGNANYVIDNVKWNDNSIYFIVPTIKDFYGKDLNIKVIVGSNDKFKSFGFTNIVYHPVYTINGYVAADENGTFPQYVNINSSKIEVNNGNFVYFPKNTGSFTVSVNEPNYDSQTVTLTDENPTANVYISYNLPMPPDINITYPVNDNNLTGDLNQTISLGNQNSNDTNQTIPIDNNTTQTITAFNPVTGEIKEYNSIKDIPSNWIQGEPVFVNVEKGISLVSGNIDFKYLPKDVLVVWSLNPQTKEWEAYSPDEKIREMIKMNGFKFIDKIDATRGFFVVADKPVRLVTYENIETNNSIDLYNLPKGYTFIGSNNSEISVYDIKCQDGYKVGGVFKYKNGHWINYIPSLNKKDFEYIEPNEGVLVQCIPQGGEK